MIEPTKLQPRLHGPYIILRVYANGRVSVRRGPHMSKKWDAENPRDFRGEECRVFHSHVMQE
eukprot:12549477-Ditylum_brightwellii.AAC.1